MRLSSTHIFEDLEQTPTFAVITLGRECAFALEVYIINQRVASLAARGNAIELPLHFLAISRLGQHFRQCILQPRNQELRLEIDDIDEKLAQLFHFRRIDCFLKLHAGIPWTRCVMSGEKELGQFRSMSGNEVDKFRKAFIKGTALVLRIPNEMADTERSEVFAGIPRSQSENCSAALILPNAFSDPLRFGLGKIDSGVGWNVCQSDDE